MNRTIEAIFVKLASAAIIGGFIVAWNFNARLARIETKLGVVSETHLTQNTKHEN